MYGRKRAAASTPFCFCLHRIKLSSYEIENRKLQLISMPKKKKPDVINKIPKPYPPFSLFSIGTFNPILIDIFRRCAPSPQIGFKIAPNMFSCYHILIFLSRVNLSFENLSRYVHTHLHIYRIPFLERASIRV